MRNLAGTAIGLLMVAHVTVQSREIDRERSTITIQVDKSGWLASFGDRHVIRAPIMHGTISESEQPAIEFEIESRYPIDTWDPRSFGSVTSTSNRSPSPAASSR